MERATPSPMRGPWRSEDGPPRLVNVPVWQLNTGTVTPDEELVQTAPEGYCRLVIEASEKSYFTRNGTYGIFSR
jgi:hypothetical protein